MNATSRTARTAIDAYEHRARGRRISSLIDRVADAAMALGALLLVNAAFGMGFNLPVGQVGLSAGGALVAAGVAWMKRPVRPARIPATAIEPVAFIDRPLATVTPISARRARHAA